MINLKYLLVFIFFLFCEALFAQQEMKNFEVKWSHINDSYYVFSKDTCSDCIDKRSAWFSVQPQNYRLLISLWQKMEAYLEKEIYEKCDSNVVFKIFITYNTKNYKVQNVVFSIPKQYYDCFSEPIYNALYSLVVSESAERPIAALLDTWWKRFPKQMERSELTQAIFRVNKEMFVRMREKE